jgi:hypothetical protein
MNRAYSVLDIKAAEDGAGKRIFRGMATTPSTDRTGDIVEPKGAEFKLPIPLLWQHNSREPVGWVTAAKVTDKGIEIEGEVANVAEPGKLKDRLDEAWQMLHAKLVQGLSIGFTAIESQRIEQTYAYRYVKWALAGAQLRHRSCERRLFHHRNQVGRPGHPPRRVWREAGHPTRSNRAGGIRHHRSRRFGSSTAATQGRRLPQVTPERNHPVKTYLRNLGLLAVLALPMLALAAVTGDLSHLTSFDWHAAGISALALANAPLAIVEQIKLFEAKRTAAQDQGVARSSTSRSRKAERSMDAKETEQHHEAAELEVGAMRQAHRLLQQAREACC